MMRATADSPQMFDNKFVDFFSRTPWFMVPIIWVPIVLGLIAYPALKLEVVWYWLPLQIACGWLLWTAAEYWLHRTIFHWDPDFAIGKRFHFIIHGVHHTWIDDKLRLVMPPVAAFSIAALFWMAFKGVAALASGWVSVTWVYAVFGGFLAGYINYDVTHYAIHHVKVKSKRLKRIRAHHLNHHFNNPDKKFGFTTLFWDKLCGTM